MKTSVLTRDEVAKIKAIGILFVLFGHTQQILWGGASGVAMFLIVSGYGMAESYLNKGLGLFWNKRIKAVWLPYFVAAVMKLLGMWGGGRSYIAATLLGADFSRNIDPTMWYISFVFLWYLIFYAAAKLTELAKLEGRAKSAALSIICLLMCIPYRYICLHTRVFDMYSGAGVYVVFFPLGVMLSTLNRLDFEAYRKHESGIWAVVLFFSTALIIRKYRPDGYGTAVALAFAMQMMAVVKLVPTGERLTKVLGWFGKYAYAIYLFEGVVLGRRAMWFANFGAQINIDIAFAVVSIAMGYVFLEYVYKNLAKTFKLEELTDKVIRV